MSTKYFELERIFAVLHCFLLILEEKLKKIKTCIMFINSICLTLIMATGGHFMSFIPLSMYTDF